MRVDVGGAVIAFEFRHLRISRDFPYSSYDSLRVLSERGDDDAHRSDQISTCSVSNLNIEGPVVNIPPILPKSCLMFG